MASQQPPARPWFRLASMARPAPATGPAPAPAPAPAPTPSAQAQTQPPPTQPRAFVRPTFIQTLRPPAAQPQEPAPPPSQPVAASPPATAPPPPATTTSVPSSPNITVSAPSSSLTSSPAPKPSPTSTVFLPVASSSSVPPSPKPIVSAAPSSSLPTSPSPNPTALSVAPSSSVPPSPKIKTISFPSSSLPTSPVPNAKAAVTYSSPAPAPPPPPSPVHAAPISVVMAARASEPKIFPPKNMIDNNINPNLAKSSPSPPPPPPPKMMPVFTPFSPLTLPPAQIKSDVQPEPKIPAEAEQKTVLLQETIEKPVVMPMPKPKTSNGEFQRYVGRETTSGPTIADRYGKREVKKDSSHASKDKGDYKKSSHSESEEFGMRIITIAGENKGAIMELSPSHKKQVTGHKKGNPITWSYGEKSGMDNSGKEEGRSTEMMNDQKDHKTMANTSPPMSAFMNSNVQGVNSSILYNCSCTHHDPGVHLSISRKLNARHGMHLKD